MKSSTQNGRSRCWRRIFEIMREIYVDVLAGCHERLETRAIRGDDKVKRREEDKRKEKKGKERGKLDRSSIFIVLTRSATAKFDRKIFKFLRRSAIIIIIKFETLQKFEIFSLM